MNQPDYHEMPEDVRKHLEEMFTVTETTPQELSEKIGKDSRLSFFERKCGARKDDRFK